MVINDLIDNFEVSFYKELWEKEEIKQKLPDISNTAWYIKYIDSKSKETTELFKNRNKFNKEILTELLQYLPSFIEFEFWNNRGISYKDLSYGEKTMNRFFYNLFYHISHFRKRRYKNFFIILDEIEIGLHPDWQKKFLSFCINIVKILETFFEIRIHIILATHSPFILSDLPKENVIFLKNGKQEKPFKENEQTFGANIHTLLSHGFFMDGGLMGEFAKEKINDVYKFLTDGESNVKTKEEAQNIINLIGEPLIKRQLENIYNRKFQIKSKDEIIQELQNKIAELEKNQND